MTHTVRCKFKCDTVSKSKHWDLQKDFLYEVRMSAVTNGSDENKSFWAATPGGQIQFNSIVDSSFEPGKEYYIDISIASEAK